MTYQEAGKMAIAVQDACNLSGVVQTWAKVVSALWAYAHEHGHGTTWVNQHPVNVLFVDKVAQLACYTASGTLCAAWNDVERIADGPIAV